MAVLLLLSTLGAVAGPAQADTYVPGDWGPSVWSNKLDYRPGEQVTLAGANWQPGESVHLLVNDDGGQTWSHEADVTADDVGSFSHGFTLPDWFVAEYSVKATGESGAVATATFTDGNLRFDLATVDQAAPSNLNWTVSTEEHSKNETCTSSDPVTGSVSYVGSSPTTAEVSIGNNQSAKPTSVAATGYRLTYWSATATSTTPVTGAQLCKPGPGSATLYAHFENAVQTTALTATDATGTYGGTTTLTATLTTGGNGVSGKSVSFTLNGNAVGSATTNASGIATLNNASLAGINAGTHNNGVAASFAGDTGFTAANATAKLTVAQKSVTGSFTASDKVYDRTDDATIATRGLAGVIGSEPVTLSGGSAKFADAKAGQNKVVTGTGFTLAGTGAGNYTLASTTLTTSASITRKPLTGSFTANDKIYDRTAAATVAGSTLPGVLGTDAVTLQVTGAAFADRFVGANKDVTASLALSGADAGNYSLTSATATAKAAITAATVTGSFTADNKGYDGTRAATVKSSGLTGVIAPDVVTLKVTNALFGTRDAGSDKTVTADLALEGADAANYKLAAATATAKADITAKPVTGSFTAFDKAYDGTRAASVKTKSLPGTVQDDDVTLDVTGAQFADEHVGQNKNVAANLALSGADAHNYALTSATASTTASITAKKLTGSFTADDKDYDGNVSATILTRDVSGIIDGDHVSLTGGSATFGGPAAGVNKTVTGTGFELSGDDAGEYTLESSTLTTNATIRPKKLTGSFTAKNKVYDGTRAATVKATDLPGIIGPDRVELKVSNVLFENRNVGTDKNVSADLALDGDEAGNYALTSTTASTQANITAAPVTGSFTAENKVYDGNRGATVHSHQLDGVIGADEVVLRVTDATFDDRNVGTDKTVTANLAIDGAGAGNYELTSLTATTKANITAASVSGSFTAHNKVYDGNRDAVVKTKDLTGVLGTDKVTLEVANALFDDRNVGTDKVVTAALTLEGDDAGNYALASSTATTKANITAASVSGSFTAENKVYDGNRGATLHSQQLDGVIGLDKVTLHVSGAQFGDKKVGTGKTVTAGLSIDGDDAGNYVLASSTATTTANITALELVGSFTADNKEYDRTAVATVKSKSLVEPVAGDDVDLEVTGPHFDDRHVGQNKTVTGALSLSGGDAGNYSLKELTATATASITAKNVTGSFTADDKDYDGNVSATILTRDVHGVIDGDHLSLTGGSATFGGPAAGVNKTVTGTGFEITGDDAGEYTLASSTLTTNATIKPKQLTGSFMADDKVYDGNPDATVKSQNLAGVVGTDKVALHVTGAQFGDKKVGTGKTVTASLSIDGDDAGNYVLAGSTATTTASITAKKVTGSFTANDKVYDRTPDATVKTQALPGIIGPDIVTLELSSVRFDDRNVGQDKTVTADLALGGAGAGNYELTSLTATTKASITAKTVYGSFTAADKLYDGTTAASIIDRNLTGVISPDDVTLTGGTATFADANVGTAKPVTGTGFALTGAAKDNYALSTSTLGTTAAISYRWDGFLQPINDTAHTGEYESKFKLGSTIPVKFQIKNAAGASLQQAVLPGFDRTAYRGQCDSATTTEPNADLPLTTGTTYRWDTNQYIYNFSTKGITQAGEYRIYAKLADGTTRFVDLCLTK